MKVPTRTIELDSFKKKKEKVYSEAALPFANLVHRAKCSFSSLSIDLTFVPNFLFFRSFIDSYRRKNHLFLVCSLNRNVANLKTLFQKNLRSD